MADIFDTLAETSTEIPREVTRIEPQQEQTSVGGDIFDKLSSSVVNQPTIDSPEPQIEGIGKEQPKGFIDRLLSDYGERATRIGELFTEPTKPSFEGESKISQLSEAIPARALSALSEGLSAVAIDIPSELITSTYRTLVPIEVQSKIEQGLDETLTNFIDTPTGKKTLQAFQTGGALWENYQEKHPEDARILKAFPVVSINRWLLKLGKKAIPKGIIKKSTEFIDKATEERIKSLPLAQREAMVGQLDKKIEPIVKKQMAGITGFKAKGATKFKEEVGDKVELTKAILNNKGKLDLPEGKLIPETADDFASAMEKTKQNIWNEKMAPAIGLTEQSGFKISMRKSIDNLKKIEADDTLLGSRGNKIKNESKLLREQLEVIEAKGGFSPSNAQKFTSEVNKEADSFYSKVSPELDTEISMRIQVANDIRGEFNRLVDLTTGKELAPFKKQYKAILSAEKEVNQARNRQFKRLYGQNMPSYWDLGTDWGILTSIMTQNPKGLISAGIAKGVGVWQRGKLGIDNRVKSMFKGADKFVERQNKINATIPTPDKPVAQLLDWQPLMGVSEPRVDIKVGRNIPPLTRPTTRALPAPERFKTGGKKPLDIINQAMQDENFVKSVKAEFNNPEFWKKNRDLTELRLKLKNREPIPEGDMNELLWRVMLKTRPKEVFRPRGDK